ncbi:MAG: Na(+)-translocating NADH-quinone reductase subunit A [Saprospiraceae bacterium]
MAVDIKNGQSINIRKGYNIGLIGEAKGTPKTAHANRFALSPYSFNGISPIPKVTVEIGQNVLAGDVLFFDKVRPEVQYVSPVSGEIIEINRGAKRSISSVVILADKENKHKSFEVPSLDSDRTVLVDFMCASGLWSHINQRPFDQVPALNVVPENIFVSTFDTAPLAPDNEVVIEGEEASFKTGLDVLSRLTSGKVILGLNGKNKGTKFASFNNVASNSFSGPHPSGNVGVQIHHVAPISNGKSVWTLGVQDVITIGKMWMTGKYDASRVIAITGHVKNPGYMRTYLGASVADLIQGQVSSDASYRLISGDVLSGKSVGSGDFLHFKDDQITVLKEGNQEEMFGWLLPMKARPSISKTFLSAIFGKKEFDVTTNTHGEKRAFVETGKMESVLPMNIYPQHLMKAILAQDIEKMEGLGIYELTEEDVALCEFVDSSKNPVQKILREGLNYIKEQG